MMTALDDRDSIYRSFDVGITDYLIKPLNWITLPEKIARIALIKAHDRNLRRQFQEIHSLKEKISDRNYFGCQKNGKTNFMKLNFA